MAVVEELLRSEKSGAISFGNHKLDAKTKLEDFEHGGNLYKVKTFRELTKLEKNGMFAYESEPGTTVTNFQETANGVSFQVEGDEDAQKAFIDGVKDGSIELKSNDAWNGVMDTFDIILKNRIIQACKEFNERSRKPYYVELSVGIQTFELENYEDIQLANISADQILYEAKKNRRKSIKKKNNEL